MWLAILKFFGGPVITGLLNAYQAHLTATTTDKQTAADLAGKEIATQQAQIKAQNDLKIAEIGHAWEPEKLFAYVALSFYAKVVVWDTMFGLGVTPALKGDASLWSSMIISYYFGKRTFENVARIIKR
jgi:NAD(P)H-hydrate repair Nnr-like enzyme with NAD(P)H-hydrate epimerase domain